MSSLIWRRKHQQSTTEVLFPLIFTTVFIEILKKESDFHVKTPIFYNNNIPQQGIQLKNVLPPEIPAFYSWMNVKMLFFLFLN